MAVSAMAMDLTGPLPFSTGQWPDGGIPADTARGYPRTSQTIATPTAIANMTAVTKTHGPAPTAFIILPLVGAFFVDITNALVIQLFLRF